MNILNILYGMALIPLGIWLTIAQVKFFGKGIRDFSGGHVKLLIAGIGLVIGGIILIIKYI